MSVPITTTGSISAGEADGGAIRPIDLTQAGQYAVRSDQTLDFAAGTGTTSETLSLGSPPAGATHLLVQYIGGPGITAEIRLRINGAATGIGLLPGGFLLLAGGSVSTLVLDHTQAVTVRVIAYG
jgi:hypothetical protein